MIRRISKPIPDGEIPRRRFTRHEVISIRVTQEELASARCPICRSALVARQGRAGPYFHCACVRPR